MGPCTECYPTLKTVLLPLSLKFLCIVAISMAQIISLLVPDCLTGNLMRSLLSVDLPSANQTKWTSENEKWGYSGLPAPSARPAQGDPLLPYFMAHSSFATEGVRRFLPGSENLGIVCACAHVTGKGKHQMQIGFNYFCVI